MIGFSYAGSDPLFDTPQKKENPLELISYNIPGVFESNVPSIHYEFWDLISKDLKRKVNFHFEPVRRGSRELKNRKNSCLYIASLNKNYYKNTVKMNPDDLLFSDVLTTMNLKVYSRYGLKPITSIDELKGKTIIFRTPYSGREQDALSSLSNANANVIRVDSQERAFEMLSKGRVDYGVGYDTNVKLFYEKQGLSPFPVSKDFNLFKFEQGLVCKKSEENKKVIEAFNRISKILKKTGEMALLFNLK
jgi:ABC-type amino acid transport substrate-binding protein